MMKNGEWRESKKEHDKSKLLGVSSFFVVYLLYKLLYKKKKKEKKKKKKRKKKRKKKYRQTATSSHPRTYIRVPFVGATF